jgi:hypothetical protein
VPSGRDQNFSSLVRLLFPAEGLRWIPLRLTGPPALPPLLIPELDRLLAGELLAFLQQRGHGPIMAGWLQGRQLDSG